MTAVIAVPADTAALITRGTVTVVTAEQRGEDGRVLIRAGDIREWGAVAAVVASRAAIRPGCIVASAVVEWVPILDLAVKVPMPARYVGAVPAASRLLVPTGKLAPFWDDISDQLPHGDFTPGRWAGLLSDVKATTERCPACWGDSGGQPCRECQDGLLSLYPIPCDEEVWP